MLLLGSMSAEERLAAFLLNLSQRFAAPGSGLGIRPMPGPLSHTLMLRGRRNL
jgi:CRP-like cAMP-binding protein